MFLNITKVPVHVKQGNYMTIKLIYLTVALLMRYKYRKKY